MIMRKLCPSLVIFTFLAMASVFQVKAQSDFRVQSVFLYNFTRLVAWPADYQTGDFVVAVFGNSPIYSEVVAMAETKKAGNQNIVAKTFNSAADISKCHILYVPSTQNRRLEEIVEALNSKNIKALIVTDSRNAIRSGSVINFTVVDSRQRFELSQANAARMGLTLGTEISRLAILAD
jgi:hypothetical protein